MKIKHVITCGCSYSDPSSGHNWTNVLENKLRDSQVEFNHVGMGSQGNELIQKKSSLALIDALEKYNPDEILMIVMWSGTERKTFYVDNKDFIDDVSKNWSKDIESIWWGTQFADLKSKVDRSNFVNNPRTNLPTFYNKNSGWYICNYLFPDSTFIKEYFNLSSTIISQATITLENIVMLQNLCELKGVKFLQSFYGSYVYEDIIKNKDHLNLNYLYKQLNYDTIISTVGLYEHLRPLREDNTQSFLQNIFKQLFYDNGTNKYFLDDNWHPNSLGSTKWVEEILVPVLKNKGILDEDKIDQRSTSRI
jgi:hypothetical protein